MPLPAVAGSDDGGASAVDGDVRLAVDALGSRRRYFNVQDAAIDEHTVVGLDAVVGGRLGIDVVARVEDDVVSRVDAVVVVAVDLQCPLAVEQQLTLAVESTLVVVFRTGAVSQFVGGTLSQHDIGTLLAEQVQGGTVRVGDVHTVQHHLVLFLAQDGQRTIAGGAGDVVADTFL